MVDFDCIIHIIKKYVTPTLIAFIEFAVIMSLAISTCKQKESYEDKIERIKNEKQTSVIKKIDYDTIFIESPRYITKNITDTLYRYIIKDDVVVDTVMMPLVQKCFKKEGVYNLCVSGIEPLSVDSLSVFQEKTYITNTDVVYKNSWSVMAGLGAVYEYGKIIPNACVSFANSDKAAFGMNLGFDKNNGFSYGINLQIKIK